MTLSTCPHCGAEFSRYVPDACISLFGCGAGIYDDGHKSHSFRCYERQLAARAAEITRLGAVLTNIAEHGGTTDEESGLSHNGSWCAEQARCALDVK